LRALEADYGQRVARLEASTAAAERQATLEARDAAPCHRTASPARPALMEQISQGGGAVCSLCLGARVPAAQRPGVMDRPRDPGGPQRPA
jgi:hypothetical protein